MRTALPSIPAVMDLSPPGTSPSPLPCPGTRSRGPLALAHKTSIQRIQVEKYFFQLLSKAVAGQRRVPWSHGAALPGRRWGCRKCHAGAGGGRHPRGCCRGSCCGTPRPRRSRGRGQKRFQQVITGLTHFVQTRKVIDSSRFAGCSEITRSPQGGLSQRRGCRAAVAYAPAAGAGLPSAAEPTRAASACRWNAARGEAG